MPTLADAVQNAANALNNAVANVLGLRAEFVERLTAVNNSATTVINNFLGRPPIQLVYCDPINGSDANDGSTPAKAKKSIDTILDNLGTTATELRLLNDAVIRRRRGVYPSLTILGVQASNNAAGYIIVNRSLSFLGTAENSPIDFTGTFCSGMWLYGPNFIANSITFVLPNQPAGQDYAAHISSISGANVSTVACTLTVASAAAGSLFKSYGNTLNAYLGISLGAGAAGHLFGGVAAGANPNNLYDYKSNITSA